MEKRFNEGLVDKIFDLGKHFRSDGNASHDGLMIFHVRDTPKGADKDTGVMTLFNGCPCNFAHAILEAALKDKAIGMALLKAAAIYQAQSMPPELKELLTGLAKVIEEQQKHETAIKNQTRDAQKN